MEIRKHSVWLALSAMLIMSAASCTKPTTTVTSPKEQFGHEVGADYILLTYDQIVDYWQKLDRESDRMTLVDIGKTAEGRTMWMAIITSPENHRNLDRYRDISSRLAHAAGLTEEEARQLAAEGRAVVWTDGGLHATEIVNAQQEVEIVHQLVSQDDPETLRFLDDLIILTTITNPDGLELVANWYMREEDPTKRQTRGIPRLYHKYVGHDNNRDFYMANMPETEAVCRVLYQEWFPQIMYNKHQTGPVGTVLFAPPFTPLHNYYLDPLITVGIDLVGASIHNRLVAENKPGAVTREMFSTWWNGGGRTTPYYHNQIGLLTEVNGNPTPQAIPFVPNRILPDSNNPFPVQPKKVFHFREAIDYIVSVDRAIFDVASKYRENFLYNMYLMGKRSIERGSEDHWTFLPKQVEAVKAVIEEDRSREAVAVDASPRSRYFRRGAPYKYYEMLRDPAKRDARGYILPADQADFPTATKFVNALIKNGITIHRATQSFEVGGKTYPQGSYVIKTAQAFRPHILDMLEPQDHPDDIPYPGGPPTPPYDSAGYTLAYQMGVRFDRILDGFDGPFEKVEGLAQPAEGSVTNAQAHGFLIDHRVNDAFITVNRLLRGDTEVYRLRNPIDTNGKTYPEGSIYIPAGEAASSILTQAAREFGLTIDGVEAGPAGEAYRLKPVRVGLWDRYGGSMPSGWTRWLLEQFEFNFKVVYAPEMDAGNLAENYDVLIFPNGAIPERDPARPTQFPDPETIPEEYRDRLAAVTVGKTVPQLRQFVEDGGAIITMGSSANLGYHLRLPVRNALLEGGRALPREKYYMPGSVHQVRVDTSHPLAYGLPENLDVYFNNNPLFNLRPGRNIQSVAWYDKEDPLRCRRECRCGEREGLPVRTADQLPRPIAWDLQVSLQRYLLGECRRD